MSAVSWHPLPVAIGLSVRLSGGAMVTEMNRFQAGFGHPWEDSMNDNGKDVHLPFAWS